MTNTVYVEEWDIFSVKQEESTLSIELDEIFSYDYDPLAFTLASIHNGKYLSEVHLMLSIKDRTIDRYDYNKEEYNDLVSKTSNFQSEANKIRKYYKNKLFMRRLKSYHISRYMTVLEEILEKPYQLKQSQISALLKMPDFYKSDVETDLIINQHVSLKGNPRKEEVDDVFVHVGTVQRMTKTKNEQCYYFANSQKNLLLIPISNKDSNYTLTNNLMNYITKLKQPVRITGYCEANHELRYEEFLMYKNGFFNFDPIS
jgi:hypothetical protein